MFRNFHILIEFIEASINKVAKEHTVTLKIKKLGTLIMLSLEEDIP